MTIHIARSIAIHIATYLYRYVCRYVYTTTTTSHYHLLHVICYILYGYVLHIPYCILHATCYMLHTKYYILHTTCWMLHTTTTATTNTIVTMIGGLTFITMNTIITIVIEGIVIITVMTRNSLITNITITSPVSITLTCVADFRSLVTPKGPGGGVWGVEKLRADSIGQCRGVLATSVPRVWRWHGIKYCFYRVYSSSSSSTSSSSSSTSSIAV